MCLRLYSSARKTVKEGSGFVVAQRTFCTTSSVLSLIFSVVLPLFDVNKKHLIIHSHQGFTGIMSRIYIWRRQHLVPGEMKSVERAQKFHTDDNRRVPPYPDLGSVSDLVVPRGKLASINQKHYPGMSLRASCGLISAADKELTASSNCFVKQRHGRILKEQLCKKRCLD